jgi:ribosomal protein S18 acetylase RimI-like enzyme
MGGAAANAKLTRRPITEEDLPFLTRLYASTREEEIALLPWSEQQKAAFLQSQFDAQHRHYSEQNPDASFELLLLDGEPAGRLYVDRRSEEIHIIDIALLPQFRGAGVGSSLLREILTEASSCGVAVGLFVEHNNRAHSLYRRLGFNAIADTGIYLQMQWRPASIDTDQVKTAS